MRRWLVVLVAVVAAVTVPVGREVAGASPDTEYPAAVNGLGHLVHYWRFEDEPATYDDFADQVSAQGALALTRFPNSTVGVTGALAGGAPGKAFSVPSSSGTTAYGDKQDDGSGTPWSSATVDLWIKPAVLPAVGTPAVIFDAQEWSGSYSKEMGLTMWLDSNGRVHGSAGFAGTANLSPTVEAISQSVASVGTWSHVTLTYDESGMLFLGFDGTDEVTKWTPAAPLRWFAQSVGVAYPGFAVGGTANGTPDKAFQGSIDEVAFVAGDESGTAMDIGDMRDLQVASGHAVGGIPARDPRELLGPNDSMRNKALCRECSGDPIDTGSGNEFMPVPGISVAGRGPGLAVRAAYNSGAADIDQGVGYGWSSSLGMRLERSVDGRLSVVQETGATVPFSPGAGSTWTTAPRFSATLTYDSGSSRYTFTRNHFERFVFDSPPATSSTSPTTIGRLVTIADQFGNATKLEYPSSTSLEPSALYQGSSLATSGNRRLDITWSGGTDHHGRRPATGRVRRAPNPGVHLRRQR